MKRFLLALLLLSAPLSFGQSAGVGNIWTYLGPTTLQSGATANGNGTAMAVAGLSSAVFTVNCSVACSGGTTINLEGSADNSNFVALSAIQLGTATIGTTILNQGTTITAWQTPIGALQSIRARISGYSAGTITVTATASAAPWDTKLLNANLFMAGTAADGNSGAKSAATQRVVLATDQPQLTAKLLVTPDSVALPANQSVNAAQLAGTTTDTNSGNKSAGTLRVVLATDQPQLTAKLLVTPDSVALPANQSTNESQINSVTPLMNNGVSGTGSQRVNIASDNTPFLVKVEGNAGAAFDAATGAAPPANAILHAGLGSGATGGLMLAIPVCDSTFNINISTATTTLAVTGVSGRHVRICALDMVAAAADNVGIISGTGATCGTGTAAIVGTTAATGYNFPANGGIAIGSGIGQIKRTVATGDSVCIVTSAGTQLSGTIAYTIY